MSKGIFSIIWTIFLWVILSGPSSLAADFDWHGFTSIVAAQSNHQIVVNDDTTNDLNLTNLSRFGLSGSLVLNEKLDFMVQAVALGTQNSSFSPYVNYALINFKPDNQSYFRFGRILTPVWQISEYKYVGNLYPWVRPPIEVYELNPLTSTNGLSANWKWIGAFETHLEFFAGSGTVNSSAGAGQTITSSKDLEIMGGSVKVSGEEWTARLSVVHSPDADFNIVDPQVIPGAAIGVPGANVGVNFVEPLDLGAVDFYSAGATYSKGNLKIWTELASLHAKKIIDEQTGAYFTVGYEVCGEKCLLHLTYADFLKNSLASNNTVVTPGRQISNTLGFNYMFNQNVTFKAEITHTSLLDQGWALSGWSQDPSGFNSAPGQNGLAKSYEVYAFSMDFVF